MSCPEIGLHIYKLKTGHMKQKLFQPHYDVAFKSKVIEEYLSTGCTKMSLLRKYNIAFKSAITTWMRVLGYTDTATHVQIPTFGQLTLISLPKKTNQPLNVEEVLQCKIKELQLQLQDEKLRSEAYARIIDKAEKELKLSITKKFATR